MVGYTLPSYIPGVQFQSNSADHIKRTPENDSSHLHVVWNDDNEKIAINSSTTAEELGATLLSICGLQVEDLTMEVCLSLWQNDKQVIGHIVPNSANEPYTIKLSSVLHEDTLQPLWQDIASLKEEVAALNMDKLVMNGSLYAPMADESTYIEKYIFTDEIKEALTKPSFNNWEYEDNELVALVMEIYNDLDIPEYFDISQQTLFSFVNTVRNHYNNNPFHCFKHGFCVLQMAYALIYQSNILEQLTMLERLILITSCLGHDLDHPGYNNAYQVNAKTDLAIIYNDNAPLENHHSAMLFAILRLPSCNLMAGLNHLTAAIVRKGIIRCIMATDMAKHGEYLQVYTKSIPNFSLQDGENRANLLCMIIKCADISTEVRPPHIADVWVNRLLDEFFSQSDREKADGLPFLPFMDRDKVTKPGAQVGFLSFVVIPLYEALGKLYPSIEADFITPIRKSLEYYKSLQNAEKV